jgi:DnaK suppressor protein
MDFKSYKLRLQKKERELLSDIGRFERGAREAGDSEVGDPTDRATTSEGKSTSFGESTLEWQTLVHVREALQRIEDGSFGKCVDCGRPIEPARLEAIPWTPYCHEDQEKHDHAAPALGGSTL